MRQYVEIMGYLYSPSKRNFVKYLKAVAYGSDVEREPAENYLGRCVGKVHRCTDLTEDEAKCKLEDLA